MFHSERSFKDFLLGLAIGGSVGAFLFNSKQGKHIQKGFLNRYHTMSKKAQHFLKEGIEKLTHFHAKPVKKKTRPSSKRKKTARTKRSK